MPTFCAMTPERMSFAFLPCCFGTGPAERRARQFLEFDLDVDTGRQVELHQRIDGLRRWIDNIEQAFVRAHLELLAALLVDVRRAIDREALNSGGQRNRPPH